MRCRVRRRGGHGYGWSGTKVLVTGTEGYLGCLLAPTLVADGHEGIGLDTGFYKTGSPDIGVDGFTCDIGGRI